MQELRDNIRSNWTTTGLELTKELRQFWINSRSGSPAPGLKSGHESDAASLKSPTAVTHMGHLDIPRSDSPSGRASNDFVTGYSLGLIGGVRSWVGYLFLSIGLYILGESSQLTGSLQMTKSRRSLNNNHPGSRSPSDEDEDSADAKSPVDDNTPTRGRKGRKSEGEIMDTTT